MSYRSIQKFKLAVTVAVSLGLGFARVLPIQAASVAKPSHNLQSLESQRFKVNEPNLKLNITPTSPTPTYTTKNQGVINGVKPGAFDTQGINIAAGDADQKEDDSAAGGFFGLALLVALIILIINSFSNNKSPASTTPPQSTTALPPEGTTGGTSTSPLPGGDQGINDPVPVPTPALLPGLLALSVKLLRQRKDQTEMALESELSQ